MSKRKLLSKPKPNSVEVLNDTGLEIDWGAIEKITGPAYEKPQIGDLTREALAEHYGISERNVNAQIDALVNSGLYRKVSIIGPHKRPRIVLRKVK